MTKEVSPQGYNMWTIPRQLWDSPLAKVDQSGLSEEPREISEERWAEIEERLKKFKRPDRRRRNDRKI